MCCTQEQTTRRRTLSRVKLVRDTQGFPRGCFKDLYAMYVHDIRQETVVRTWCISWCCVPARFHIPSLSTLWCVLLILLRCSAVKKQHKACRTYVQNNRDTLELMYEGSLEHRRAFRFWGNVDDLHVGPFVSTSLHCRKSLRTLASACCNTSPAVASTGGGK